MLRHKFYYPIAMCVIYVLFLLCPTSKYMCKCQGKESLVMFNVIQFSKAVPGSLNNTSELPWNQEIQASFKHHPYCTTMKYRASVYKIFQTKQQVSLIKSLQN